MATTSFFVLVLASPYLSFLMKQYDSYRKDFHEILYVGVLLKYRV